MPAPPTLTRLEPKSHSTRAAARLRTPCAGGKPEASRARSSSRRLAAAAREWPSSARPSARLRPSARAVDVAREAREARRQHAAGRAVAASPISFADTSARAVGGTRAGQSASASPASPRPSAARRPADADDSAAAEAASEAAVSFPRSLPTLPSGFSETSAKAGLARRAFQRRDLRRVKYARGFWKSIAGFSSMCARRVTGARLGQGTTLNGSSRRRSLPVVVSVASTMTVYLPGLSGARLTNFAKVRCSTGAGEASFNS